MIYIKYCLDDKEQAERYLCDYCIQRKGKIYHAQFLAREKGMQVASAASHKKDKKI